MNLVKDWGYEPLLPANLPTFPPLHPVMYCVVGLTILISGAYLFILLVPSSPANLSTPSPFTDCSVGLTNNHPDPRWVSLYPYHSWPTFPPLHPVLTERWDRPITILIPGGYPFILTTAGQPFHRFTLSFTGWWN
jgi:hypothetical protein